MWASLSATRSRFNLGLLLRKLIGVGTPRGLHGRAIAVIAALLALLGALWDRLRSMGLVEPFPSRGRHVTTEFVVVHTGVRERAFTTGC